MQRYLLNSVSPFISPRGNTKLEEACEMYTKAANMFKIAKNWSGIYRHFLSSL